METRDLRERLNVLKSKKPGTVMELEELELDALQLAEEAITSLEAITKLTPEDWLKLYNELKKGTLEETIFGGVSDFAGCGRSHP